MRALLFAFILILPAKYTQAENFVFAVGPDHQQMLTGHYPLYQGLFDFTQAALASQNHQLTVVSLPWSRARSQVESGQAHGLFLAADLKGREQWASLSVLLGYDAFGFFVRADDRNADILTGMVRTEHAVEILPDITTDDMIQFTTAKKGMEMLTLGRLDRFLMSQSYGEFILAEHYPERQGDVVFLQEVSARRGAHVAFAKSDTDSQKLLALFNQAIQAGIDSGLYLQKMRQHSVPVHMRIDEKD